MANSCELLHVSLNFRTESDRETWILVVVHDDNFPTGNCFVGEVKSSGAILTRN
jgi:hypothetical protein